MLENAACVWGDALPFMRKARHAELMRLQAAKAEGVAKERKQRAEARCASRPVHISTYMKCHVRAWAYLHARNAADCAVCCSARRLRAWLHMHAGFTVCALMCTPAVLQAPEGGIGGGAAGTAAAGAHRSGDD